MDLFSKGQKIRCDSLEAVMDKLYISFMGEKELEIILKKQRRVPSSLQDILQITKSKVVFLARFPFKVEN